jgi:hypothetical protein
MTEIKKMLTCNCQWPWYLLFPVTSSRVIRRKVQTLRRNLLPFVRLNVGVFLSYHIASYSGRHKIILAVRFGLGWNREESPIRLRTQEWQGEPSLPPPSPHHLALTQCYSSLYSATLLYAALLFFTQCYSSFCDLWQTFRMSDTYCCKGMGFTDTTAMSLEMCCRCAAGYTCVFKKNESGWEQNERMVIRSPICVHFIHIANNAVI